MENSRTKKDISLREWNLILVCRKINYGKVESILVKGGDPIEIEIAKTSIRLDKDRDIQSFFDL